MGNGADDRLDARNRAIEAKAKGYEGLACAECGNFTLIPHGTGYKCDTCGTTTGEAPVEDKDGVPIHSESGC